jgi:hypothetical protein
MQGCAAIAAQWGIPYNPHFWCDWRTDVRLRELDQELVGLVASARVDDLRE